MLSLTQPSDARINRFLRDARGRPLTYPGPGLTSGLETPGYVRDRNRIKLGEGRRTFDRACQALRDGAMLRGGWFEAVPPRLDLAEGEVVGILGHVYGVWALFACRIVAVFEGHGATERFGFAYGTLPGHLLSGEERFSVEWEPETGAVWFEIFAVSRPNGVLGRLAYPALRPIQTSFPPVSLGAMARAVNGPG